MKIQFKKLTEVSKNDIIDLMNNPLVQRHMPLASFHFNESECDKFITTKKKIWNEYGYGPWAIIENNKFIGWGGLQPEGKDVEVALVLHPENWGVGKVVYEKIIDYAFSVHGLESVIVLFPLSRTRVKGLLRLGFELDGKLEVEGVPFLRYRLCAFSK